MERLGDGSEENPVNNSLILKRDRPNGVRKREDDVEVLYIEKVLLSGLEPLAPCRRLTLWTMTVSTRVVRDLHVAALVTFLLVTTEGCSTAILYCAESSLLL